MERLDALCVREDREGKSRFTRIGVAFPNKDGKGFTVLLDAVPASNEGQYKIMLREPLPKDGQRGGGTPAADWGNKPADDLDDDIPFISNETIF